jgi:hypothetical protein
MLRIGVLHPPKIKSISFFFFLFSSYFQWNRKQKHLSIVIFVFKETNDIVLVLTYFGSMYYLVPHSRSSAAFSSLLVELFVSFFTVTHRC